MEFKDRFGNEIECTVEEYKELTKMPRMVSKVPDDDQIDRAFKRPKKSSKDGRSKRMKEIHNYLNNLRKDHPYMNYHTAFGKANHAWNKKHGGK